MAITWRNIDAPDLRGASAMTAQAGQSFQNALAGIGAIAEEQEQRVLDINTQAALEQIQGIKNIEQYQNTSFDALVGKYGDQVNREELFKAFDSRDEQIYQEQDFLRKRAIDDDIRSTSTTVDSFISEGLLGGKNQEELRQGIELLIQDKPTEVKEAVRNNMVKQFEYENSLTPEGQMKYDLATKSIDTAYQVQEQNLLDKLAIQEAIVARDPMRRISEVDAELSIADYVNKYAPDEFELDWSKYEGDDIDDLLSEARGDADLLAKINKQMPEGSSKLTHIPEQVLEFVIKTAVRTTDNKLRLDNFENNVINAALEFNAYNRDAQAAKKNISTLRNSQIKLNEQKAKEYAIARKRIKNLKSSESNLIGNR